MYGIFIYIYHKNQPNVGKYFPYMVWQWELVFFLQISGESDHNTNQKSHQLRKAHTEEGYTPDNQLKSPEN